MFTLRGSDLLEIIQLMNGRVWIKSRDGGNVIKYKNLYYNFNILIEPIVLDFLYAPWRSSQCY